MNLAPSGPHLLDTSAVILMMRLGSTASADASVPFVAYAELLVGVERSHEPVREDAQMFAAIGTTPVLYPDIDTLVVYARISAQLQKVGRPIPTNDIWIAALALQWGLPVLSSDAHFQRVPGLNFLSAR